MNSTRYPQCVISCVYNYSTCICHACLRCASGRSSTAHGNAPEHALLSLRLLLWLIKSQAFAL
eukprot:COSAG02_NODE_14428_length_1273_cov_7.948893_2_plen_62_part_01